MPCQNCNELLARVSITPVERPSDLFVPPRAKGNVPVVILPVSKLGIRAAAKVPEFTRSAGILPFLKTPSVETLQFITSFVPLKSIK